MVAGVEVFCINCTNQTVTIKKDVIPQDHTVHVCTYSRASLSTPGFHPQQV